MPHGICILSNVFAKEDYAAESVESPSCFNCRYEVNVAEFSQSLSRGNTAEGSHAA